MPAANNDPIIFPPRNREDVFVHVPAGLGRAYLETVLSRSLGRKAAVSRCAAANLCEGKWGKVSCCGATVLRLSLTLSDGAALEVVAKILSPDPVNLFKIDCRFDARLAEIAWAKWWGEQHVPFAAGVYDTRADAASREFWILQEYFPVVGWPDMNLGHEKHFTADVARLSRLFRHAADLHAHSRNKIDELTLLFGGNGLRQGYACRLPEMEDALRAFCRDAAFCESIGVTRDERQRLERCVDAAHNRPRWVDGWDVVCVSNDLAPDNFAVRGAGDSAEYVTFDWGTAHLAPMELELDLLLRRIRAVEAATRAELLRLYIEAYERRSGRSIDPAAFAARMPWARFVFHLGMIADHADSLRWVPHQTRSREYIRMFIGVCERTLRECATTA